MRFLYVSFAPTATFRGKVGAGLLVLGLISPSGFKALADAANAVVSVYSVANAENSAAAADERILLIPPQGDDAEDRAIRQAQLRLTASALTEANLEALGWAFVAKARRTQDAGYYKLAEKAAEVLETHFGKTPSGLLLVGHVAHNLHHFAAAEAVARELVSSRGSARDYGLLSDALTEQGKLTEAVDACQEMMNRLPGVEAEARAAHLRWLSGDLPGATAAMRNVAAEASVAGGETYAWALTRLTGYELQSGRLDLAEASAARALQAADDYPPALLIAGKVAWAQKKPAAAIDLLQRATDLNPLPEYQWWLADALRDAGEEAKAISIEAHIRRFGAAADGRTVALYFATRRADADQALKLAQDELAKRQDALTWDAIAWAQAQSGAVQEAWQTLAPVLKAPPADGRVFMHAAIIASRAGHPAEALGYSQQAHALSAALAPSERRLLNEAFPQSFLGASHGGDQNTENPNKS